MIHKINKLDVLMASEDELMNNLRVFIRSARSQSPFFYYFDLGDAKLFSKCPEAVSVKPLACRASLPDLSKV